MSDVVEIKKTGLLTDSDGTLSSKRVSAVVCLIVAVGLAITGVVTGNDAMPYVIAFLSAAGTFQGLTVLQGK